MKKELCLVLGANGFIGSHLVDELVGKGYAVRAFDRFQDRSIPPRYKESADVELFAGDIYDTASLKKSLKNVDYVFHCFSATTPHSSDNDPYTDIDKNLKPSIDIFNACVEQGVKKVIFMSSGGAIYGSVAEERNASEDDVPMPVSPYGITKLGIEGYMAYFNRKSGMNYIAYRLSNPYGPRQVFRNSQGVIPAFISQINEGKPIVVFGDGTASRDYVYIGDVVKMIVGSFNKPNQRPVYNIGSGKQTTINEIIQGLKSAMGKDISIEYEETPETFLKSAGLSIDSFVSEFGIRPSTSMEEGLKNMLDGS